MGTSAPNSTTSAITVASHAEPSVTEPRASAPAQYEPRWYAVYTSANREKGVARQLDLRHVEHFLPTFSSVRRWKDRKVTLQSPLFPGYVFVRLALWDRLRVLQIPGVVRFVGFGALPAALPQEEIETLRSGLSPRLCAEPHPFLTVGRRVRIKAGSLQGLEGILVRRKGNLRVVVSVALISRSIAVDVDASELEEIATARISAASGSIR